ncbi:protein phosphatase 1A [Eurytemora carolleeae]|uniref:protein phosphatase 1A n=1 Tax=Eurytemora carolleeae TaxID=1294199 RepID=UPI000C77E5B1|nr:protein phosphatase 1A [Eurytemora carolleeae]|eukprot:XP_023331879.1 protein phosphatase 1A-like [Eurytemora affinis]
MGAFLDKPKTEKYNESKIGGGLRYGLSSMQGWRIEMEDAHSAIIGIPDQKETVSWFGVFDGHAGSRVRFVFRFLCRTNDDFTCSLQQEHTLSKDEMTDAVKRGMLKGFLELDEKLRKIPEVASGEDKSGTTAVCALITDKYLILANCGDSRGVFCVSGKPALATQDHKPSNEPERERIQNAGGTVMIQRVNGSLAVSRALGDFEYKNVEGKGPTEQLVSPEPEFFIKVLFVIILVFKFLGIVFLFICHSFAFLFRKCFILQDICDFISARMKISDNLETICNEVIDTCLNKGSRDNMSIIIIAFPAAPKVDPAAVKADQQLNELLEKKVTGKFLLTGFAPGGGFASKKVFIEEVYRKLLPEKYESSQDDCPNPLASLLFANARNAAAEDN